MSGASSVSRSVLARKERSIFSAAASSASKPWRPLPSSRSHRCARPKASTSAGFARVRVGVAPGAVAPSGVTASFRPGDRTVFHTHRHPVTVYVLEGAFTLEMEGHAPVVVRAGEALVEPPDTRMTGYNRADGPLRVLIVYVAEPGTPFLDPAR